MHAINFSYILLIPIRQWTPWLIDWTNMALVRDWTLLFSSLFAALELTSSCSRALVLLLCSSVGPGACRVQQLSRNLILHPTDLWYRRIRTLLVHSEPLCEQSWIHRFIHTRRPSTRNCCQGQQNINIPPSIFLFDALYLSPTTDFIFHARVLVLMRKNSTVQKYATNFPSLFDPIIQQRGSVLILYSHFVTRRFYVAIARVVCMALHAWID